MRSRRTLVAAVCALATLIAFAGCSGDEPNNEAGPAEETNSPPSQAPPACLSGIDAPKGVDPARPAVAVKIENSPAARPQSGLEDADVVFEERVEGGITRFLVIYHCGDAAHAGPVRSGRFDDPKIAKPFTRLLAASGSNAIVEKEIQTQGLRYISEQSAPDAALFRDPPGSTDVHSLFANTEKLRKLANGKVKAPTQKVFKFGAIEGKARRARAVTINFTESNTIEYKWQGGAWKRYEAGSPFLTAGGTQIAVENLLIQEVRVDNSKTIVDSVGFPSPDIKLEKAKGKAVLFRDGKAIKGTWKMGKVGDPPVYRTKAGGPMVFAPGAIWIELVPSKAGEVKGRFSIR